MYLWDLPGIEPDYEHLLNRKPRQTNANQPQLRQLQKQLQPTTHIQEKEINNERKRKGGEREIEKEHPLKL